MSSSSTSNFSCIVRNIRKAEAIILSPSTNNETQAEKDDEVNELWESQVDCLRSAIEAAASSVRKIAIILDIEGTITPLYFVTKILFPFFVQNCESFVKKNLTQKVLDAATSQSSACPSSFSALEQSLVEVAKEFIQYSLSFSSSSAPSCCSDIVAPATTTATSHLLQQFQSELIKDSLEHTRANRKIPYMKKLQGVCWQQAYIDGSIQGDVFTDLIPLLEQMSRPSSPKVEVHIYSSGSIFAQKLLLGYSRFGDLTSKIVDYHDTVSAGMKGESSSYQNIFGKIRHSGTETNEQLVCIFVSDSLMELRAARKASLSAMTEEQKTQTHKGSASLPCADAVFVPVLAIRPQNPALPLDDEREGEGDVNFVSVFSMAQITEAVLGSCATNCPAAKELQQIRKDVEKYSIAENEERSAFN